MSLLGSNTSVGPPDPGTFRSFTGFIYTAALTSCFLARKLASAGCKFAECTPNSGAGSLWFYCIYAFRLMLSIRGICFRDSRARLQSRSLVEIISGVGLISWIAIFDSCSVRACDSLRDLFYVKSRSIFMSDLYYFCMQIKYS